MVAVSEPEEHPNPQFVAWTICTYNPSQYATNFPPTVMLSAHSGSCPQPACFCSWSLLDRDRDNNPMVPMSLEWCIVPLRLALLLHLAYCWLSLEKI